MTDDSQNELDLGGKTIKEPLIQIADDRGMPSNI
jgi:hypothetical protein